MDFKVTVKNYRCFEDSQPVSFKLGKKFTAFVGPNNAGKSTILKLLYELRPMWQQLLPDSRDVLAALAGTNRAPVPLLEVPDPDSIMCDRNTRDLSVAVQLLDAPQRKGRPAPVQSVTIVARRGDRAWSLGVSDAYGNAVPGNKAFGWNNGVLTSNETTTGDFFPIAEAFDSLARAIYIGPFRNILNVEAQQRYFDIVIGRAFVSEWKRLKTGPNKSENETVHRMSADLGRLFGFSDLQINASDDGTTLQVLIEGKSYRLHEVGAGLAQFIIVAANVAVKRPSYVLIDEPELGLHPSLQLSFLTLLGGYASHGVVLSSHSLGLARSGAESVYSVRRNEGGTTEVRPLEATTNYAELAGEMSFGSYQALGFDQILLVEGVSEVKAVQQLLRCYGKDQKVVLVPLGGGSLIKANTEVELSELKRLCPRVSALIDSERASPGAALTVDRAAFQAACGKIGIGCHVLERRAFEHYMTAAALNRALPNAKALAPFDPVPQDWRKSENWKVAREMTRADLAGTDLGTFLEAL